ncbi:MAG TPA: hypothetical protein VMT49_08765 [Steroidobacteraceae bacterium]|nr:hypothetical protein [Steroidobacteraceae bacterium]
MAVPRAALLLMTMPALAQMPPVRVVEAAVESGLLGVHWPDAAPGTVILLSCGGCSVHELALPANVAFTINGRNATLADVRQAAGVHSDATVTLHYLPGPRRISRVDVTVF